MLMAAICNINIFFYHKKITTIIIMLCLEDLSSNVLCRNGRGRKKTDLIFCILEGKTKFADGVGAEMLALLISTVKVSGETALPRA